MLYELRYTRFGPVCPTLSMCEQLISIQRWVETKIYFFAYFRKLLAKIKVVEYFRVNMCHIGENARSSLTTFAVFAKI
jgi:hypothetical protein